MFFPRVMQCLKGLMPKNVLSNLSSRSESSYQRSPYAKRSLDGVILLMRHGARTPSASYPRDPYRGRNWAGSPGVLLPLGERQMEVSGYKKAKRYGTVLPIDVENLKAVSSDSPRSIRSLEKFLDGFLWKRWPNNLISVVPKSQDKFLTPKGRPCPAYIPTFTEKCSFKNPDVKKYLNELGVGGNFIRYIEENTGLTIKKGIEDFYHLNDILTTQLENGYNLPSWAKPVYRDYIRPLGNLSYYQMVTSDYMRIRTGALLSDLSNKIQAIVTNQTRQIMTVYSVHDFVLSALHHFLGIYDLCGQMPKYGACSAIEVHENRKTRDGTEVKFFYFNDYKDKHPVQHQMRSCKKPCSYYNFVQAIRPRIVNDYERVCSGRRTMPNERSKKDRTKRHAEDPLFPDFSPPCRKKDEPFHDGGHDSPRKRFVPNKPDFPRELKTVSYKRNLKPETDACSFCSERSNVIFTGDPLPGEEQNCKVNNKNIESTRHKKKEKFC